MPSVLLSLLGLGLGALHASSVSAGQVPVVDGVIGGVRTSDSTTKNLETLASDVRASTPTPGALRVTENSGICGECYFLEGSFGWVVTLTIMLSSETTEGVYQASGYGDLSEDESVWCVYVPRTCSDDRYHVRAHGCRSLTMRGFVQVLVLRSA